MGHCHYIKYNISTLKYSCKPISGYHHHFFKKFFWTYFLYVEYDKLSSNGVIVANIALYDSTNEFMTYCGKVIQSHYSIKYICICPVFTSLSYNMRYLLDMKILIWILKHQFYACQNFEIILLRYWKCP